MPQPFQLDDELDVEVTLIQAYDFCDAPKPSLQAVTKLIRDGALPGYRSEKGTWRVPSIAQFEAALRDWIKASNWSEVAVWNAIPPGFVGVLGFCREHVPQTVGLAQRLYSDVPDRGRPQFSAWAKELIAAEDLDVTKAHGKIWVAKPTEVKLWLYRRFGIRV
jgi:hypothetical protein